MNHSNHTDAELVLLLREGDSLAFSTIYHRHAHDLFRFARKTLKDKEVCEEILQDVFVSLWERREALHILSLKYYLLNAVRYKVIHHIRHSKVIARYEQHYKHFEARYETAGCRATQYGCHLG